MNQNLINHIEKQIMRLQSPKAGVRYEACNNLAAAPEITSEAIKALQNALNDSDQKVAGEAKRALNIHLPSETSQNEKPIIKDRPTVSPSAYIIMFVVVTAIFIGISSLTKFESTCTGILFIPYIAFVIGIIAAYVQVQNNVNKNASDTENHLRLYQQLNEKYNEIKSATNISDAAKIVLYYAVSAKSQNSPNNSKFDVYLWKDNDNVYLFPTPPASYNSISLEDIKQIIIPLHQIEYFSTRGEIFRENKISGGGGSGGGSSIKGAIAGELIAGDVGAVIGSRKKIKINEIKSELITHDTRETFLNYFDERNVRHSLFFDINAHQILTDLLPEKEFNIVNALRSSGIIRAQTKSSDKENIVGQIRALAELKTEGIISEEEFNEKKKILLDKIA